MQKSYAFLSKAVSLVLRYMAKVLDKRNQHSTSLIPSEYFQLSDKILWLDMPCYCFLKFLSLSMLLGHGKCLLCGPYFFCIFNNSGNKIASCKAWRLFNHYNYCPRARTAHVAKYRQPMQISTYLSDIVIFFLCNSFGCKLWTIAMYSKSHQGLNAKFCTQPSGLAVLFSRNLSRYLFLKKVINLDLLLWIGFGKEHANLFWYLTTFTQW